MFRKSLLLLGCILIIVVHPHGTVRDLTLAVGRSYQKMQDATARSCSFCSEYGGSPLTNEPFDDEQLQRDPLYQVVRDLRSLEARNDYLASLLRRFNPSHNWGHFTYHLAAVIAAGADPNTPSCVKGKVKNHVWRYALVRDNLDFIRFLLAHNTNPDVVVMNSKRAIDWVHSAAAAGLLLDAGIRPVTVKPHSIQYHFYGRKPVEIYGILCLFRSHGVNLLGTDHTWTALHVFARHASRFDQNLDELRNIAEILFCAGVDIEAQTGDTTYKSGSATVRFKTAEEIVTTFNKGDSPAALELLSLIQLERENRAARWEQYRADLKYAQKSNIIKRAWRAFEEHAAQYVVRGDCAICISEGCADCKLPCGHKYCKACISAWLTDHKTCPKCRAGAETDAITVLRLSEMLVVPEQSGE